MEEYLHWTETWSVVILQPYRAGSASIPILHNQDILVMWQALRAIVLHFMRPFAEHASEAACDSVANHLRTYSHGVERVFGPKECKYNLHLIVCRQDTGNSVLFFFNVYTICVTYACAGKTVATEQYFALMHILILSHVHHYWS